MEKLKAILKEALSAKVSQINIIAGQQVETVSQNSSNTHSQFGIAEQNWLLILLQNLFPKDQVKLNDGEAVRSPLNIPGVGQLFLVGKKTPAHQALHIFLPPDQDKNSQNFLQQLLKPSMPTININFSIPQAADDAESISRFSVPNATNNTNNLSSIPFSNPFVAADEDQPPEPSLPSPNIPPPMPDIKFSSPSTPGMDSNPFSMESLGTDSSQQPVRDELPIFHGEDKNLTLEPDLNSESLSNDPFSTLSPQPNVGNSDLDFSISDQQQNFAASFPNESLIGNSSKPATYQASEESYVGFEQPEKNFSQSFIAKSQSASELDEAEEVFFENQLPGTISKGTGDNAIDKVLIEMIEKRASDLHLTIDQPIIFRIDGDITRMDGAPLNADMMRKYFDPIIPKVKKKQFNDTWDIDFAYEVTGVGRFRVNMFRDYYGVGAVLRHIPDEVISADKLGLPESIRRFCKLTKGLVLVTGPTGSGKSTTLAAMIDLINSERAEHILTIEDPIEFVHSQKKCLINQREVGKHTGSFSAALKAALREDPDIVLVGELRDLETTAIAIETAETGHLVFGTLHTNTAISTVDRIIDQFPTDQQRIIRNMLASSMKGVVSQTLCKKIGGGRCAAYEVLVPNDAVGAMIRESKIHMLTNHMQTASQDGNLLMVDSLVTLVQQGKVSYWEAWKKAIDKKDFQEFAKRKNVTPPKQ